MSADEQQQDQPRQQPEGALQPAGDPGFTPERDKRMIMLSCVTLILMTLAIFILVRKRLVELSDVTGAYTQVYMTDAEEIRSQAVAVDSAAIVADPAGHTAQWLSGSGTVLFIHDKKGAPINPDNPNSALGSVYWLDCGLPVTAVRPLAPVCGIGERIEFRGQVADTEVRRLEFADETGRQVLEHFGLQPQQHIAIFFASEIEPAGPSSPLNEEVDEVAETGGSAAAAD
ncbi:MAG: hypothetical protein R3F46_02870 [bacterium]